MLIGITVSAIFCAFTVFTAVKSSAQVDDASLQEIRDLLDRSELETAESMLENLLQDNADSAELLLLQGMVFLQRVDEVSLIRKLGYSRRGRQALEQALLLDPNLVEAKKELSDYYYYAPAIAGGDQAFAAQLIAEIEPLDEVYYLLARGGREMESGKLSAARETFLEALRLDPMSFDVLVELGVTHRRLQEYTESRAVLSRAMVIQPDFVLGYFHLGLIGVASREAPLQAIEQFRKYIELGGLQAPLRDQAWYRIGMLYEMANDKESARFSYNSSLQVNPEFEPAQSALRELERGL